MNAQIHAREQNDYLACPFQDHKTATEIHYLSKESLIFHTSKRGAAGMCYKVPIRASLTYNKKCYDWLGGPVFIMMFNYCSAQHVKHVTQHYYITLSSKSVI